ncbi:MAG: hypothetical protein ACJ77B_09935 [Chloroflexota bacterium]
MVGIARRVGIVIGSVVMAYLAVSLVGGVLLGPSVFRNPLVGVVVVVLGGLIYGDIMRRERRRAVSPAEPAR